MWLKIPLNVVCFIKIHMIKTYFYVEHVCHFKVYSSIQYKN